MDAAAPLPLPAGQARAAPAPAPAAAAPDGDERGQPQPEAGGEHQNQVMETETETEEEHTVYCAVGIGIGTGSGSGSRKNQAAEEWKANLRWVLAALAPRRRSSSSSSSRRLVLAHLRRPTSRINIMGAWVPVSQLAEEEVAAYRQLEEERVAKVLDDLLQICRSQQVNASKIIIASDDVARGLVQLVDDHGVTELVMGAASDRAYSRKMRTPRSKKALTVQRKANPSCRSWFVCRGNLICTREASLGQAHVAESSTASTSPRTSTCVCSRSKSSPCLHSETFSTLESDDLSAEQTPAARDRSIEDSYHQTTAIAGSSAESISETVGAQMEPAAVHLLQENEEDRETPALDGSTQDNPDSKQQRVSFLQLGYSELDEATKHFDESVRIDGGGGGGRGKVYRGELRNMAVAVKVVDRDVAVGEARFARAAEGIGRARHPNVVALVGACPAARAVVYELVPGGSLEERLGGGNGSGPALPWHARCGVAYGACSALAFLHSRATVHGDVRPANILVVEDDDDARRGWSWSCKLGGLGVRGLVEERARARARPAAARAYADPRATGEPSPSLSLTPQHGDVYALGVVLLRLVTGRPAFLARKAAREAASGRASWQEVTTAAGGGWPTERAREVGLRCCGVDGVDSDVRGWPRVPVPVPVPAAALLEEARAVLEAAAMMSAAPPSRSLSDSDGAPPYFLCPILKEVMRDPQVAGDGFSYEAAAIAEWLRVRGGHGTSPMTNLKLPTRKLVPNHALRSAIHEWRHRRQLLHAHRRLH